MNKRLIVPGAAAALLCIQPALAGGLWLNEFGDFAGGRASAGAAAGTDEAAAIVHNPAGTRDVASNSLFTAVGYLMPTVEFDIDSANPLLGDDDGGQAGEAAAISTLAYVNDFGAERWDFGVYMTGLAGSGLDYGQEWVGRYQVTKVDLLVLALAPTAAWHVTDRLSVGVAPQLYYANLELDVNVPALLNPGAPDNRASLDGDDTGVSYMAGLTYRFGEHTRLGLSYQSELDIDFDGELKLRSGVSSDLDRLASSNTELPLAARLRLGLHHDLSERLGLDLTVGWDNWSTLDSVLVSVNSVGGSASLNKNWHDTYHYAAGFQYAVDSEWDLTAGIAYDTDPVDAEDRTADLPVDRQLRYNVGLRRSLGDALTIGGYLNYTDLGDADIDARLLQGDYRGENKFWQIALNLSWRM